MEEDEDTQKSIPPWVELEHAVRQHYPPPILTLTTHPAPSFLTAHAHARRSRRTRLFHASLKTVVSTLDRIFPSRIWVRSGRGRLLGRPRSSPPQEQC